VLLAELLTLDAALREAILGRPDTAALEAAAARSGRKTIWDAAEQAVAEGLTAPEEVERVLGPRG
jgi:type II secretory ATPase GspE/PulE/Tfp pilus assembly ATPase PilB-like protein